MKGFLIMIIIMIKPQLGQPCASQSSSQAHLSWPQPPCPLPSHSSPTQKSALPAPETPVPHPTNHFVSHIPKKKKSQKSYNLNNHIIKTHNNHIIWNVSIVCLLETKVKEINAQRIQNAIFLVGILFIIINLIDWEGFGFAGILT